MDKDYKKTNKNEINTNELDEIREIDTNILNKVSGGAGPDKWKIVKEVGITMAAYGSPDYFRHLEEERKKRENAGKTCKDGDKNEGIKPIGLTGK